VGLTSPQKLCGKAESTKEPTSALCTAGMATSLAIPPNPSIVGIGGELGELMPSPCAVTAPEDGGELVGADSGP